MSEASFPRAALVTGASGFIGRQLVEALLASSVHVVALTRPSSRIPEALRDGVERIDCADWTLTGFERALGKRSFDVGYHLASYGVRPSDRDIEPMQQINAEVPCHLVRLCKERNANLLITGSSAEYRVAQTPLVEQSPLETEKIYGASKAKGGMRSRALAEELGVRMRLLRLFNVFGPGEAPYRLLPSLIAGLAAKKRVPLSSGTQIRDFIYVADVIEAMLAADAQMKSNSQPVTAIWNVCSGVGHSVRAFASTAAEIIGAEKTLLGFGDIALRADETAYLVGCADRIRAELGWNPRHDLASGIRAALAPLMPADVLAAAGSRSYK